MGTRSKVLLSAAGGVILLEIGAVTGGIMAQHASVRPSAPIPAIIKPYIRPNPAVKPVMRPAPRR